MRGRKTILIFDNFEDLQHEENNSYLIKDKKLKSFLIFLIQNTPPNCHLLFTTRYKIIELEKDIKHIQLDKMGYAEQYRYMNLSEVLRSIPINQREILYRRLDGHPRSLEYLEGFKRNSSIEDWQNFQNYLEQAESKIFDNLLLEKLYSQLPKTTQLLLQQAGVLIGRSSIESLVAISEQSIVNIQLLLQNLQSWSLCYWNGKELEVHALTKEWLKQNKYPDSIKYKVWTYKAGKYFESVSSDNWEEKLLAKDYFEKSEAWEEFVNISLILSRFYQRTGYYDKALLLTQYAINKPIEDKRKSDLWNELGLIQQHFGDYEESLRYLKLSLKIDKQFKNLKGEGATLSNIAQIYINQANYSKALNLFQEAIKIQKKSGDRHGEAKSLNDMALIYQTLGKIDIAVDYHELSLAIKKEIGDRRGEGDSLNNLATIKFRKGDYNSALQLFQSSLEIDKELKYPKGRAITLSNIGKIHQEMKSYDIALKFYEDCLLIQQEIKDLRGEGSTFNNIGQVYHALRKHKIAMEFIEKGLKIHQEIGNRKGEATSLNSISGIYYDKKDFKKSLSLLKRSLKIRKAIGDAYGLAENLHNLGVIYYDIKEFEKALNSLIQALSIFDEIDSPKRENTKKYIEAVSKQIGIKRFKELMKQYSN